ncbi:Transposase [Posidoniimonas polymericola]|uniref:Transposase n=1 Tax=Posidoniimonas polymericola TaxID=2528002 RepID=A0A5C5XUB7_9BACT|nr:transposase [Posidoniimonas polymericola]TWT66896.1 Transposase [Posidoniimonas polymericola]
MDDQSKRKRPTYSEEFKRDAVRLVVEEGYSIKAASQAVGVCEASLRGWHAKLVPPPEPCGEEATVAELRDELKRVRRQLKRAELEREILKKATAYFAKEST